MEMLKGTGHEGQSKMTKAVQKQWPHIETGKAEDKEEKEKDELSKSLCNSIPPLVCLCYKGNKSSALQSIGIPSLISKEHLALKSTAES